MIGKHKHHIALGPLVGASLAALAGAPSSTQAEVGVWAEGAMASARLIAEGVGEDGRLAAGIEIVMPVGWKTYWRNPGDAGIAPVFDFSASDNVGEADIRFPTPMRYDDGYSVINVYQERVVFPVTIPVVDREQPIRLKVRLDLGVCEVVCVPDSLDLALDVPTAGYDERAARMLEAAEAKLPGAPEPGVFSVLDISREGGTDKRPIFTVSAIVPDAEDAEVFIAGPEGWFPGVPAYAGSEDEAATYRVKFSRLGADTPIEGAEFVLVVVSGDRAIEQQVGLD